MADSQNKPDKPDLAPGAAQAEVQEHGNAGEAVRESSHAEASDEGHALSRIDTVRDDVDPHDENQYHAIPR
jgi:hypothetical protein